MKIAFDENIPPVMVKVFQTLAAEGNILKAEIVSARDYVVTTGLGDVPWLQRFAKDGGKVVISGDKKMRSNPHERLALAEAGFITFMFAPKWGEANSFTKCAMLLHWWPKIQQYIEKSKRGQCWEIPFSWAATGLKEVSGPAIEEMASKVVKLPGGKNRIKE